MPLLICSFHYLYILWQTAGRSEWSGIYGNQLAPPPKALHGLPPFNDAGLRIIKQGCLGLKGLANYCDLGSLEKYRQYLCDRLEVLYGQRESDRWKVNWMDNG